jgi:hypothetical protein
LPELDAVKAFTAAWLIVIVVGILMAWLTPGPEVINTCGAPGCVGIDPSPR